MSYCNSSEALNKNRQLSPAPWQTVTQLSQPVQPMQPYQLIQPSVLQQMPQNIMPVQAQPMQQPVQPMQPSQLIQPSVLQQMPQNIIPVQTQPMQQPAQFQQFQWPQQPQITAAYPPTLESPMYVPGYLKTQIGKKVKVEFLIGTNMLVDREGTLVAVGASFIIINEVETDDLLLCDLYSIKFVRFYF